MFNERLERLRNEIVMLYDADDRTKFYIERRDEFDEIMFPPLGSFKVIQIPVKLLLSESKVGLAESGLSERDLERLRDSGAYPTDFGKAIGGLLR